MKNRQLSPYNDLLRSMTLLVQEHGLPDCLRVLADVASDRAVAWQGRNPQIADTYDSVIQPLYELSDKVEKRGLR